MDSPVNRGLKTGSAADSSVLIQPLLQAPHTTRAVHEQLSTELENVTKSRPWLDCHRILTVTAT